MGKTSMATALRAKGVECEWTDEQFEEELDKESKDCKDDLSFMLAEKNKDWPELKPEEEMKAEEKEKEEKAKGVDCDWTDEQFEEELDKESKDCKDDLSFMLAEKNKD